MRQDKTFIDDIPSRCVKVDLNPLRRKYGNLLDSRVPTMVPGGHAFKHKLQLFAFENVRPFKGNVTLDRASWSTKNVCYNYYYYLFDQYKLQQSSYNSTRQNINGKTI